MGALKNLTAYPTAKIGSNSGFFAAPDWQDFDVFEHDVDYSDEFA